ncbi:GTPase IMAP family member 8-like [Engraulis encrasicolus]|uniref:GTPase IMAP family member 8-like n=1 Tax=Engraulis encrasicolus TaxID=184585 RepID=UPI002FD3E220
MSLCPPGPHAILLVIELDSPFSSTEEKSVREHCELLGRDIWDHTVVLFTKGDLLVDVTIEEYIRNQGKALEWLVQRCGGRYHVFDNKSAYDQSQVRALLDKIDQLTASNHGRPFEVDQLSLKRIEEAKKTDKDRAIAYKDSVTQRRARIKANGDVLSLPEIRILLVGWVLSGKSNAGDTILNGDHFSPGKVTEKATCALGEVLGRSLRVVDTPGWWKFLPSKYTPTRVKQELMRGLTLCGKYPHAVLLTLTADVSFHEEQRRIIQDTLEAFLGKDVWRHVVIIFTFKHVMKETSMEEVIEGEGEALKCLVERCGHRYHVIMNMRSQGDEDGRQVADLLEKIEEMVAGNCVFCPDAEEATRCAEAGEEKTRGKETDDPCIEDVINTLDKEWLRTDQKMIEEVQKKWVAAVAKSDRSMDEPIKTDSRHSDESDRSLQKQQSNDDDELSVHLKDLLECEWRRRDYIIKEIVNEAVQKLSQHFDLTSEPGVQERDQSTQKVMQWNTDKSSGVGSEFDSMYLEEED